MIENEAFWVAATAVATVGLLVVTAVYAWTTFQLGLRWDYGDSALISGWDYGDSALISDYGDRITVTVH